MELPTAPFIFISSEGKKASFFQSGKLQILWQKAYLVLFQSIQCCLFTYLCGSLRCLQKLFCQKPQSKISFIVLRMPTIPKRCSSCPRSCSGSMQNMTLKIQVDCSIAPYTKPVKKKGVFLHTEDERATLLSFSLSSYQKNQTKRFARLAFSTETCKAEM